MSDDDPTPNTTADTTSDAVDSLRNTPAIDEAMISGYLDGELTQGDAQRVRIHLENNPASSRLADELRRLREATMTTTFIQPDDTQWDERPRTTASRLARTLGFVLLGLWAVGLMVFLGWQLATDGQPTRFDAFIGLAPLVAVTLVVGSTLLDRIETRKTDPYRKVQK